MTIPEPVLVNDDNFDEVASYYLGLAPTTLGLDTETTGLYPYYGDYVAGVSLYARKHSQGHYFPVAHAADTLWGSQLNLSSAHQQELLQLLELLTSRNHIFLMWNAPFDMAMLINAGLSQWPARVLDVQVAAQLVDETRSRRLADRGVQDLSLECLQEAELAIAQLGGKSKIASYDPTDVAQYAVLDAWAPCQLWPIYLELLQMTGQEQLWGVMQTEMQVTPLLWRMQRRGLACDRDLLHCGKDNCTERMDRLAQQIRNLLHDPSLNIGDPKKLQKLLNLPTTAKLTLAKCSHPAAPLILQWRSYQKLRGSYFRDLGEYSSRAHDLRLHPCLNQTGTRTGRFSCNSPNLQSIPRIYDQPQDVPLVRDCIVADPGYVFVFADYAQAELRLVAHYTKDVAMYTTMAAGNDPHNSTAELLFDADFTPTQRHTAKTMNYAMQYGAGVQEIALQLDCDMGVAQDLLNRYRRVHPGIAGFSMRVQSKASARGYVRMWNGRRCRYPDTSSDYTYKASSHLIQGGVAELVKRAMLQIDAALLQRGWGEVIFQIHDEVVSLVPAEHAEEAAQLIKQAGEQFPVSPSDSAPLFDPAPLLEVSTGPTWAQKTSCT